MLSKHIVCLNLDERISQRERISRESSSVGLEVSFFLVGNGTLFPANEYDYINQDPPKNRVGYPAWVRRPNSWNAFMSYKKIIEKAKDNSWPYVGLMEDDCTLLPNFEQTVRAAHEELARLPNWEMLYYCANHTWTPTQCLSPHVLKLSGSGGFQFVFIKETLFQKFIDMPMICPIDEAAGRYIHKKHNCYAVWPNVARPLPGFSFCEGNIYDNTKLYDNRGC